MMKNIRYSILLITLIFGSVSLFSQSTGSNVNGAAKLLSSDRNLTFGGYGQIDYNQPIENGKIQNGKLDVHRLVLLFGYRFNDRLNFVSEIEVEHVKEVYVEQAFLNYNINTYIQVRGGLMLVPMGIINEYHEPTTFNGVERPLIDKYIAPTTWREIGVGIVGAIPEISLKYQSYIMNGFSSYNSTSLLNGGDGMRGGRQKGAKSYIRTPVSASRIEYFGVLGLNVGFSAYFGKTQSTLFKEVEKSDLSTLAIADSSVVNMTMFGFDASYQKRGVQLRVQFYYTRLSNTAQYNYFTSSNGSPNDLGSSMYGYYVEAGYNVFQELPKIKSELIAFIRYSEYDTQNTVADGLAKNSAYAMNVITTGIGWKPISEVAIKADIQFLKSQQDSDFHSLFSAGIAIWF